MNRLAASFAGTALLLGIVSPAGAADDWMERLDDYLALSVFHGAVRARISGLIDLEAYSIDQPPPGLIFSEENQFLNPRLSLFLDVQVGPYVYAFAQARVDRGFDPSDHDVDVRLDEYAIRISPWEDGRLSIQAGRFSTVVGNWVPRHLSWDNPFITAPIPYENLTGIWDIAAADSPETLLDWAHVRHPPSPGFDSEAYEDKVLRLPIVWGPSYATGVAISGKLGQFEYAVEMKNAGLASRPESWDLNEVDFDHPAFMGALAGGQIRPGTSASPLARELTSCAKQSHRYLPVAMSATIASCSWPRILALSGTICSFGPSFMKYVMKCHGSAMSTPSRTMWKVSIRLLRSSTGRYAGTTKCSTPSRCPMVATRPGEITSGASTQPWAIASPPSPS
jgi:hypothetical protein